MHLSSKELDNSITVSDELFSKLEKFVCQLYGRAFYKTTNKLSHNIVRQKYIVRGTGVLPCIEGLDIGLVPPCRKLFNSIVFVATTKL